MAKELSNPGRRPTLGLPGALGVCSTAATHTGRSAKHRKWGRGAPFLFAEQPVRDRVLGFGRWGDSEGPGEDGSNHLGDDFVLPNARFDVRAEDQERDMCVI